MPSGYGHMLGLASQTDPLLHAPKWCLVPTWLHRIKVKPWIMVRAVQVLSWAGGLHNLKLQDHAGYAMSSWLWLAHEA